MERQPFSAEAAFEADVYDELRRLANAFLKQERRSHTLQATALVNETFLRLSTSRGPTWASKAEFFRVAAVAMRRILVDHARKRLAEKRGGGATVQLESEPAALRSDWDTDILELEDALIQLKSIGPRKAQIVELRFFADQSISEIAAILSISQSTIQNEWREARAWLRTKLSPESVHRLQGPFQ